MLQDPKICLLLSSLFYSLIQHSFFITGSMYLQLWNFLSSFLGVEFGESKSYFHFVLFFFQDFSSLTHGPMNLAANIMYSKRASNAKERMGSRQKPQCIITYLQKQHIGDGRWYSMRMEIERKLE